jgi:pyridoxamine 5'-phosphate oxidase
MRNHKESRMTDRSGVFAGSDPIAIFKDWLAEAEKTELNDPNALVLSTVDSSGMPNTRVVLLKDIEADAFVFYTNYTSVKAQELDFSGKASFVMYWKSLRRQIRVRGNIERVGGAQADAYFASRSVDSRTGAWASRQSQPIKDRAALEAQVVAAKAKVGDDPQRPDFWGGYRLRPTEMEFWRDGTARVHDRFKWTRSGDAWETTRLNP